MRRLPRPSPAMTVAFIALSIALAPTAAALRGTNTVSSNDIIKGAVKKSEAGRDSVGKSEAREDSDPGGGFGGEQIDEGTLATVPTARAVANHAFVREGRLLRNRGATSSRMAATGVYEVVFARDVRACVYIATLVGRTPGEVAVRPHPSARNTVEVLTFNSAGRPAERAFYVALSC